MFNNRFFIEAGGLMSYGPNYSDQFRRAAELVDKILRGTKPGDIPVEQPSRFELVVNLTTAKALGLTNTRSMPPRQVMKFAMRRCGTSVPKSCAKRSQNWRRCTCP
jgi:putative ABC transport system substrate-binding protein